MDAPYAPYHSSVGLWKFTTGEQIPGQSKKPERNDIGVLLTRHTDSDKAQTHSQQTTMLNIILESLQAMVGSRKEQPLVPGSHGNCLFNSRSHSDRP